MKTYFQGTVTEVMPLREYGDKHIKDVEIRCVELVPPGTMYPQELPFSVTFNPLAGKVDRTAMAASLHVGDTIGFFFTPRGRRWSPGKGQRSRVFITLKICSDIRVIGKDGVLFNEVAKNFSGGYSLDEIHAREAYERGLVPDDPPETEDDDLSPNTADGTAMEEHTLNDSKVFVW